MLLQFLIIHAIFIFIFMFQAIYIFFWYESSKGRKLVMNINN